MQNIFSSAGHSPRKGFKLWQDLLNAQLIPIEIESLGDGPFRAECEAASIGPLRFSRFTQGAFRSETSAASHRRHDKGDTVVVIFKEHGVSTSVQGDRESVQRAGDILVLEWRASVRTTLTDSQSLFVEVPRERLESTLGSVRRYAGLPIGANLASTQLATQFIRQLTRVGPDLAPDSAARAASAAIDLIAAGIAERMEREVPWSLHGTVMVQRAKAYVGANLGDRTLDPPRLAAAIGLSLHRLQELFHEKGLTLSDYIWHRRHEAAAKRLSDPGCAHLSIGAVAQSCGFASQTHFSRRFKALRGMTPSEYRVTHLLGSGRRP